MSLKQFKQELLDALKADISAIENLGEEVFDKLEGIFTKHADEATTPTEQDAGTDAVVVPAAELEATQAAAAGGANTNGAPVPTDLTPGNKQVLAPRGTPSNVHVEGTTCKPTGSVALPVNTDTTKPAPVAEADAAAGATEEGMKAGVTGADAAATAQAEPTSAGIDPNAGGVVSKEDADAGNLDPANNGTTASDAAQAQAALPADVSSNGASGVAAQDGTQLPTADEQAAATAADANKSAS